MRGDLLFHQRKEAFSWKNNPNNSVSYKMRITDPESLGSLINSLDFFFLTLAAAAVSNYVARAPGDT